MSGRSPSAVARPAAAAGAAPLATEWPCATVGAGHSAVAQPGAATGAGAATGPRVSAVVGWGGRGPGALAFLVALLVVLGHVRPAVAYPFSGVALLLGWVLALVESVLVARRAGVALRGAAPAGAALAAFVAWCWGRTAFSTVPADGAETLTTLLEGLAAFWMGAFLVAAGRAWRGGPQESRGEENLVRGNELDARRATPEPLPLAAGERFLTLLFAVVAAGVSLYAVVQYHYLYPIRYVQESARYAALLAEGAPADPVTAGVIYALKSRRVGATFGNPNVLAGFLALCVPLLAVAPWTVARARRRAMAGAVAACGAMLCYAAWCTGSDGGVLVLTIAMALTAAGLAVRRWRVGAWLAVGVAAAGFAVAQFPSNGRAAAAGAETTGDEASAITLSANAAATSPTATSVPAHFSFLRNLTAKKVTIQQRLFYLRTAWHLWRRAPWAGHGLGAYGRLYGQERVPGAGESQYVHNVAAQVAVETGLVGLAAAGVFVGLLAWRWGRGLRTLARGGSPVPAALGAAVALFLLDSLGELTFYDREVLLDVCLLAGGLCAAAGASSATGAAGASAVVAAPFPAQRRALWAAGAAAILAVAGLAVVGVPSQMGRYWTQTARDAVAEVGAAAKAGADADRAWWAEQASRAADRAVWWQPRSPWPYQMRSAVAGMLQRPEQAESDLRYAVSLNPQSARLHSDLANWTLRLRPNAQGMREAMTLADAAVALHPLKSTYHEQRARLLAIQGRREEALAEAREAVRLAFLDDEKVSSRETLVLLEKPERP